jgi:hypothetical protein
MKRHVFNVSMFVLAPFIGLAYVLLLPVVSTTLLVWYTSVHYLPNSLRELLETILGPAATDFRKLLTHA